MRTPHVNRAKVGKVAQVSLAKITRIIPARGIFNVVVIKIRRLEIRIVSTGFNSAQKAGIEKKDGYALYMFERQRSDPDLLYIRAHVFVRVPVPSAINFLMNFKSISLQCGFNGRL